jgi:hypothetical protein
MAELVRPDVRYRRSFVEAMAEFADEGRTGDHSMVGDDIAGYSATWGSPAGFAAYVDRLILDATEPRQAELRRDHELLLGQGDEYLGRIAVRHRLNAWLREVGGHIGYDVRRLGSAAGATPPRCSGPCCPFCRGPRHRAGAGHLRHRQRRRRSGSSRRAGVLEDERRGKLRYWVRRRLMRAPGKLVPVPAPGRPRPGNWCQFPAPGRPGQETGAGFRQNGFLSTSSTLRSPRSPSRWLVRSCGSLAESSRARPARRTGESVRPPYDAGTGVVDASS